MPPSKWKIKIFACTLIFVLITSADGLSASLAQSPSPSSVLQKAKDDYNFQYTKYREAEENYQSARASYISFKTAVSKNDAYQKTKSHLEQTDNLYVSYLLLVQESANSLDWLTHGADKDIAGNTINEEIDFLKDHQKRVLSANILEELPPLATELEDHIDDTTVPKINKVIATIEVIETEDALDKFNILSNILDRVVIFKVRAGETQSILLNWSSEIKDIREKTVQKSQEARKELEKRQENTLNDTALDRINDLSNEADVEIRRSKPLFEELLRIL